MSLDTDYLAPDGDFEDINMEVIDALLQMNGYNPQTPVYGSVLTRINFGQPDDLLVSFKQYGKLVTLKVNIRLSTVEEIGSNYRKDIEA